MKAGKIVEQAGRKSWLASMGAYSEGVEKSTDKLDKLYVDSNAFIQDLITRGESIDAKLKAKFNAKLKEKVMFKDKIAMLKAKFGMQSDSRDIQLEKLSTKVDNLIEVVAKLAQQKAAVKPAAKAPAKAPAKSTAAKTTAAKTTAAKSTAAKTTAAKAATETKTATKKPATKKATATKTAAKPRTSSASTAKKPAASKD